MQVKILLFTLLLSLWCACGNDNTEPSTTAETTDTPETESPCSFKMQGMQTLPNSHYKLVNGLRYCIGDAQITKELVLFAQGEPINNNKECNVFATTDTSIRWELKLSQAKIEVLFEGRKPIDSTLLMQNSTVYDSIEIVYSIKNPAAS